MVGLLGRLLREFSEDFSDNGIPYNLTVTFYSMNYFFSAYAMILFQSDANSNADHFLLIMLSLEHWSKLSTAATR
jgi:hypothetical protein